MSDFGPRTPPDAEPQPFLPYVICIAAQERLHYFMIHELWKLHKCTDMIR